MVEPGAPEVCLQAGREPVVAEHDTVETARRSPVRPGRCVAQPRAQPVGDPAEPAAMAVTRPVVDLQHDVDALPAQPEPLVEARAARAAASRRRERRRVRPGAASGRAAARAEPARRSGARRSAGPAPKSRSSNRPAAVRRHDHDEPDRPPRPRGADCGRAHRVGRCPTTTRRHRRARREDEAGRLGATAASEPGRGGATTPRRNGQTRQVGQRNRRRLPRRAREPAHPLTGSPARGARRSAPDRCPGSRRVRHRRERRRAAGGSRRSSAP